MVMLTLAPGVRTCANERAGKNYELNRVALGRTQPELAVGMGEEMPKLEYLFGRDGALTAMDANGDWLGGCSVPLLAARQMLKSMQLGGRTGCFLDPCHAAQIRVALDAIGRNQAMLVLLNDPAALQVMLACEDFSAEIQAHRLWFCHGEDLTTGIERLFDDHPGLATPSHFIRTLLLADEPGQSLVRTAEQAFTRINQRRRERLQNLARGPVGASSPWCIVAPMEFRLWDDAGWMLAKACDAFDAGGMVLFNPDDPAAASSLALAQASADAGVMVASNRFRADTPGIFPMDRPWVTWVTGPRVGSFVSGASKDAVLLADERWKPIAVAAGWPEDRIRVAAWPTIDKPPAIEPPAESQLVLLADAHDLKPPPAVCELSSQRVLWEQIARELVDDPFRLGNHPDRYLLQRMRTLSIAEETMDKSLFVNQLLIPAYQQGIARLLLRGQFPLRIYGRGWGGLADYSACWGGEMTGREHFQQLTRDPAAVLIHPSPMEHAHAIDALPARRLGIQHDAPALLKQATAQINGTASNRPSNRPALSREMIQSLLG
ncbi:MAG: hypothetical protein IT446_15930 [Phycisphaerales bacterium]|nr:hypothetical protein [Phycisphaerales bacterium]